MISSYYFCCSTRLNFRTALVFYLFFSFSADLFFAEDDIDYIIYADDSTSYDYEEAFQKLLQKLEQYLNILSICFLQYRVTENSGNNHWVIGTYEIREIQLQNAIFNSRCSGELLAIIIDSGFTFHDRIKKVMF